MQIRTRLTLQFALLVGSILVAFTLLIFILSANYRKQEFNERLKEKAINTAKLLIDVKEVDRDLMRIIDSTNYSSLEDAEVIVFDYFKRSKIYTSGKQPGLEITEELLAKARSNDEFVFKQGEREAIGLLYTNGLRRFVVFASATDKYGINKLNNLLIVLLIGLLASIGFTIITGLVFSRQALKPISNVIRQVSTITASNLEQRVDEGNGSDEIALLAITFNEMLVRIEKAFQIQRSFVSNASHELRTPLASITSQIEVALMKERAQDEYRRVLGSLLEDARSLTALANNLLEIARAEQDIRTMSMKPVRLDELLLQTSSEFEIVHPEYVIDILIHDNAEDEAHDLTVKGNENLLKLIFANLIDNACKFSDGKPVRVDLEFNRDHILIKVADNGIGISREDMPHIFEPFYRAQNVAHTRGHGIGLSLISKIVTLHNGSIRFDSEPGRGTTVFVKLPYSPHNKF
jgi:signal transduction histidine kinase